MQLLVVSRRRCCCSPLCFLSASSLTQQDNLPPARQLAAARVTQHHTTALHVISLPSLPVFHLVLRIGPMPFLSNSTQTLLFVAVFSTFEWQANVYDIKKRIQNINTQMNTSDTCTVLPYIVTSVWR